MSSFTGEVFVAVSLLTGHRVTVLALGLNADRFRVHTRFTAAKTAR